MFTPAKKEPSRFMQNIDLWSAAEIIGPVSTAYEEYLKENDHEKWSKAVGRIQQAIRTKILESYRNGQSKPAAESKTGGRYRA
jgi:hypothetical protein